MNSFNFSCLLKMISLLVPSHSFLPLVQVKNIFTNFHHTVHIMCINNRGNIILFVIS